MPILIALGALLLFAAVFGPQWWVRHVLAKHAADRPDLPGTGAELARHLLDEAGLQQVKVEQTDIGDHYDPDALAVRLTPPHHDGRSIAAVAVAAHEVSHAVQHARGEPAFKRRYQLVKNLDLDRPDRERHPAAGAGGVRLRARAGAADPAAPRRASRCWRSASRCM